MIGKSVLGRRFGGLLDYIADGRRSGAVGYITHPTHEISGVYYANLSANTPDAAAREMEVVARRSIRVQKPVIQLIISLHPDERHRTPQELLTATRRVVAKLGLANHQAVYAVHAERAHLHAHVAINRVGPDGKAWATWRSAVRIQQACRQVESEMGFTPHEVYQARADAVRGLKGNLHLIGPEQWTMRQLRVYERTGRPPKAIVKTKSKAERSRIASSIASIVRSAVHESGSWAAAEQKLNAHGLRFTLYENKSRRGLQIAMKDGTGVAASAVERSFSLSQLEVRWGKCELKSQQPAASIEILPPPVADAQARLLPQYREETTPRLHRRASLLHQVREAETAEMRALKEELPLRLQALRMPPMITAAMRPFMVAEYKSAAKAVRATYRQKRDDIRRQTPIRTWLQFLVEKARALLQDAITILAWLRSHLDRRHMHNTLVPGTALRTSPEVFEYRDFYAAVADTGVVEYSDRNKDLAFIDRGRAIAVVTNEENVPKKEHIETALLHADRKWGASSISGTEVFEQYAVGAATRIRAMLLQRLPESEQWKARRRTWNAVDKQRPGVPVIEQQ